MGPTQLPPHATRDPPAPAYTQSALGNQDLIDKAITMGFSRFDKVGAPGPWPH